MRLLETLIWSIAFFIGFPILWQNYIFKFESQYKYKELGFLTKEPYTIMHITSEIYVDNHFDQKKENLAIFSLKCYINKNKIH